MSKLVRAIGFGTGRVLPDYGSRCLSGVPSTVLELLGMKSDRPGLPDEVFEGVDTTGIEKVVLFVFDGFGYTEWRRQEKSGLVKLMTERGRVTPITSVFPSTTSTALTTLATGLTPQEHGLIEWFMYVEDLDMIIETLPFSPMGATRGDQLRPTTDPHILFKGDTVYKRMLNGGVDVHSFLPKRIAGSGYSSVVHDGTNVVPYSHASDLVASLRTNLQVSRDPSFFYVYWPLVDTVEHVFGPNTEESRLEAGMISHMISDGLRGLDRSTASKTLFLATADHGQILSPTRDALMLHTHEIVNESLATSASGRKILPWGGTRDMYLQIRDESLEETKAFLTKLLEGWADVFRTSDAIESGLFGTGVPTEAFASRVGNLMVLPKDKRSVWYRHPGVDPPELTGVHGGLHEDEMTIPFAVMRGSSLGS